MQFLGVTIALELASFVEFATKLDQRLSKLATPSSNKLMSTQTMKLWSSFHACRISDLRKMWTDLFTYLKLDSTQDPLLMEYHWTECLIC